MNISSLTEFEKPALHPLIQLCKWLGSLTAAFLCSLHTAIIQKRLKKEKKAKRKLQEALEYESKRREQVEQTLKQTSPTESLRSLNGETTYLSNADILQFVKGCIFAISCGFLDMEFAMLIKVTSCQIYLIHLLRIIVCFRLLQNETFTSGCSLQGFISG